MFANNTVIFQILESCDFKVSTDTRTILPGSVFFALKGDRFNGNEYALMALEKGAIAAIVDESGIENGHCYRVASALNTLQEMAALYRKSLGIPVIAIGGSNGKTTTKELSSRVLQQKYKTHVTEGNFNNHIGVPLTILKCPKDAEVMLLELGANHQGEIAELCEIAQPDIGTITNIGKEHLEGFGSIEGVARAESELYQYLLKHGGHIMVNMNDSWLRNMSSRFKDFSSYGTDDSGLSISGKILQEIPSVIGEVNGHLFKSKLPGKHNFENMLAAICIGYKMGVSWDRMQEAIERYVPKNNRSQFIEQGGYSIFLDAYNANPSSMEAALQSFERFSMQPKIALLGDMFELGEHEHAEHQAIIDWCANSALDRVYTAGSAFYGCDIITDKIKAFPGTAALLEALQKEPLPKGAILIKGSRGMAMEKLLELLN